MTTWTINSQAALQSFFGELRAEWDRHKFLRVTSKAGKTRTLSQNSISHCWYEHLARELREEDALSWKCFCKLHFGVPILRAENPEYRAFYDAAIKSFLSYEQKLDAMKFVPATSQMNREQKRKYLEAVQAHFLTRGVRLEFPPKR